MMGKSSLIMVGSRIPARILATQDIAALFPKDGEELVSLTTKRFTLGRGPYESLDTALDFSKAVIQDIARRPAAPPEVKGLAVAFSRLSNEADIMKFASSFGLLDLDVLRIRKTSPNRIEGTISGTIIDTAGHEIKFEPLEMWERK
ncbi:MAG TPA: hypothetical protein VN426_17765 [Syntrophomonadaceae bacterium]|nr:hypothetical protein [Syntrophomonadaceae bacterium]